MNKGKVDDRILSFVTNWFDPYAQCTKTFLLLYHCGTREFEMYNDVTKKKFLKKTKVPPSVMESHFFVGSRVTLLSRDIELIDYADDETKIFFEDAEERTACILLPSMYNYMGEVIAHIEDAGFVLVDLKLTRCVDSNDMDEAIELLRGANCSELGPLVAMSFRGENCVLAIHNLLKSRYGEEGVVCARKIEEAIAMGKFFYKRRPNTATFEECTCCLIKPHAITKRMVGRILSQIFDSGFIVSAAQFFQLEESDADKFLGIYSGPVPQLNDTVSEMSAGPILATTIQYRKAGKEENVVKAFNAIAGPWDVNAAKETHPDTIRGKFGENQIKNAIHCTDHPKHAKFQSEYFFKTLNNRLY